MTSTASNPAANWSSEMSLSITPSPPSPIPTAMWPFTPWSTPCWAPSARETSANISPRPTPDGKNADSALFLNHSLDLVRKAGFRVINADLTILALKPHLKPFKLQIKARLQELLNAPVNIKAGTNEECGEIGRGEAIAALAVVLLGPK